MKKIVCAVFALSLAVVLATAAYAVYGIIVTKQPAEGIWMEGESASFEAEARYYSTVDWTFVDPCGKEYTVQQFRQMFPCVTVEGENTTRLTVNNLSVELNDWAAYCGFHSETDNAKTNWAFIHVNTYAPVYTAPVCEWQPSCTPTCCPVQIYCIPPAGITPHTLQYTDGADNIILYNNERCYSQVYKDGSWECFEQNTEIHFSGYGS